MPAPPADVVRQLYAAWSNLDVAAASDLYAPNVVFDWSRRHMDPLVADGRDAVVRATAELLEPWDEAGVEIERLIEGEGWVLALVHAHGRGRASGAAGDAHVAHVWTVRDGLIERMEYYGDQAEALAAAGEAG